MTRTRKAALAALVLYCLACWAVGWAMVLATHEPNWLDVIVLGVSAPLTLPVIFLYANLR